MTRLVAERDMGERKRTTSPGPVYLREPFFFFLVTHSCGSNKSAGGLRTAFSQASGGLAQHNQRRITGRERETAGGRGKYTASIATDSENREGVNGKMTGERDCVENSMEC